jgi:murein endopeptidase
MRRLITVSLLVCLCAGIPTLARSSELREVELGEIAWRKSYPVGLPHRGALIAGVQLPAEGANHFTFDPVLGEAPNREWRRWAADTTIRTLLGVLADYRAANPGAPRVGIGDLSRPEGGAFGRRFGGLGHASHQNGLDVDLYYPRDDGLELPPESVSQINLELSAELVKRFVAAGAVYVFIGPRTKLRAAPRKIVQKLVHHDDHMHIRFVGGRRGGRTG